MFSRTGFIVILAVSLAVPLVFSTRASAIPAFTRQYKAECTTCHTIYPELNEYGEAFRKNAYVYMGKKKGGEGGPTSSPIFDPKTEAISLSAIPELLPLSLTASVDLAYNDQAVDNDKFDLTFRSLVLSAGGAFRDKAGFLITYNLYTQGVFNPEVSNTPANNNSDLVQGFLVGRQLFGTPINIRVGRIRPQVSLWQASNKLTTPDPAPLSYRVGRSTFTLDSTEDALEVNAILGSRVFAAAGVVDRNGQNQKDGYGHLSFKIGGADFHAEEPEIDLEHESIWDFLSITVGGYGYYGRNANLLGGIAFNRNDFYRAGGDLDLQYKAFRLKVLGVYGHDSNPDFLAFKSALSSCVISAEADYMFDTNLITLFRYEYQDDGSGIIRRYLPAIVYAPLQNTKLTLEYRHEDIEASSRRNEATNKIALLSLMFSL